MAISSWSHRLLTFSFVVFALAQASLAQTVTAPRCGTGVHDAEAVGTVAFPQDSIHCPLLADPKEPRTFISLLRGAFRTLDDPSGADTTIASVALGDSFGLVRWGGPNAGDGVQLDVAGGIFAQFDFGAESKDLINADYVVGLPVTFRRSGFSTRVRIYHQSSHLGDEYLLRDERIQRENLSFESIELLVSQEAGPFRVYVGGERLFRREPETLGAGLVHAGAEVRSGGGTVRVVSGADVKSSDLHDWSPAVSGRVGLEFVRSGSVGHPPRLVTLMIELYDGPSPYGQFFQDDISHVGVGFHFSL